MPKLAKSQSVNLSPEVLNSWKQAVVKMARLKGATTKRSDFTTDELLTAVMKQESRGALDLWEIFTKERGQLSKGLLSGKPETLSYVIGFHLVNVARAQLLFKRANERYRLKEYFQGLKTPLTWYDLGSGSGALTHAAYDYFIRHIKDLSKVTCHLYDVTGTLLDAAKLLMGDAPLKTHKLSLESLELSKFKGKSTGGDHWFSLGYVWNELKRNPAARSKILKLFATFSSERTGIVILEPATQDISREAMELRDQLCTMGYIPLYPCPHNTPCPMLNLSRDWCYSEGHWQRPHVMTRLDQYLKIDRSQVSGTMMLFVSKSLYESLAVRSEIQNVIVGRPVRKDSKAKIPSFDYLLCEKDGDDLSLGKKSPENSEAPRLRGQELSCQIKV